MMFSWWFSRQSFISAYFVCNSCHDRRGDTCHATSVGMLRSAMIANEAGAYAPMTKIRLGEVVREVRAPSSSIAERFRKLFAILRRPERRRHRKREACPEN